MRTKNYLKSMAKAVATRCTAFFEVPSKVSLLQDVAVTLAFFGSTVGGYFGYQEDSPTTMLLALVFMGCFSWFAILANNRVQELERRESSAAHRRMAGVVRSIVRSEVRSALSEAGLLRKENSPSGK